jgi:uracil-DNA glycosylase
MSAPRRINPRVVLVGEAPGKRDTGRTPLLGQNRGASGSRLRVMCGMSEREWRDVRRINLFTRLPDQWDNSLAHDTAHAMMHAMLRRYRVICQGRRVARAFGVSTLPMCTWQILHDAYIGPCIVSMLPHPSGRCRAYNDAATRDRAARFLQHYLIGKDS